MSKNKKIGLALTALAAVILIFVSVWFAFAPKAVSGSKEIVVAVVYADKTSKEFTFKTDAMFLGEALLDEKLVAGTESQYGLFVTTVDGVTVDDTKQEWWCFTKGGDIVTTGVESTPVGNGDHFEITFTVGY